MFRTKIIVATFIFWAASVRAAPAPPSYADAMKFYENGDFAKAMNSVNSAIKEKRRFYPAWALRALLDLEMGNQKQERSDVDFIFSKLGDDPRSGSDENRLLPQGTAFFLAGESGRAAQDFDRLINNTGVSSLTLDVAAKTDESLGELNDAADLIGRAIAQEPSALYYRDRAALEIVGGTYNVAVSDIVSLLRLNSGFPKAYSLLGDALAQSGDSARAREAYEKALRLDASDEAAELGLARVDLSQGNKDAAVADFKAALKMDPGGYSVYFARAEAFLHAPNRTNVLPDYEAAFSAQDFPGEKAESIGDRFAQMGDNAKALEAYERAGDFFQGTASEASRIFLKQAGIFEGTGDLKMALSAAKEALSLDALSPQAWLEMGRLEYEMGYPEKSISDANKAVSLDPKNPKVLLQRGELFSFMRDSTHAWADFNAVIAIDSQSARAYNDLGVLYSLSASDYDKAEPSLETAISLDPKNPEYYFNLGLLQMKENLFTSAIDSLSKALTYGGPRDIILENRAEDYSRLGDRSKAVADAQAILSENSRNASAYAILGWIYYRAADYEDAQASFEQALSIEPRNTSALTGLGEVFGAEGLLKRALKSLSDALSADSSAAPAALAYCKALRMDGQFSSSIDACDLGISDDANLSALYYQKALTEIAENKPDKALMDFKRAQDHGLRIPEQFLAQAMVHAALKHYDEAHDDYEKAYSLNPDVHQINVDLTPPSASPEGFYDSLDSIGLFSPNDRDVVHPYAFILRGDALFNAGHYDGAIQEYTGAIQTGGDIADAYLGRARCLEAQGQYNEALKDLQTALAANPAKAFLYDEEAKVYILLGQYYIDALKAEVRAVHYNPQDSEAYLEAGHIRYFMGKYAKALDNYALAVRFDPTNPRNYDGEGLGLFALKRYSEAIQNFSEAIALDPRDAVFYKNRASAYANAGDYQNALNDFRTASTLNTDPQEVAVYNRFIEETKSLLARKKQ